MDKLRLPSLPATGDLPHMQVPQFPEDAKIKDSHCTTYAHGNHYVLS